MAKKDKEEVDYDALAKQIADAQEALKAAEAAQATLAEAQKLYKSKVIKDVRATIKEYGINMWELKGATAPSTYETNMTAAYDAWKKTQPEKKSKKKEADAKK